MKYFFKNRWCWGVMNTGACRGRWSHDSSLQLNWLWGSNQQLRRLKLPLTGGRPMMHCSSTHELTHDCDCKTTECTDMLALITLHTCFICRNSLYFFIYSEKLLQSVWISAGQVLTSHDSPPTHPSVGRGPHLPQWNCLGKSTRSRTRRSFFHFY